MQYPACAANAVLRLTVPSVPAGDFSGKPNRMGVLAGVDGRVEQILAQMVAAVRHRPTPEMQSPAGGISPPGDETPPTQAEAVADLRVLLEFN